MKPIFLLFASLSLCLGCQEQTNAQKELQPLPVKKALTQAGDPMILGPLNRANLKDSLYQSWFQDSYDFYRVPQNWATDLKQKAQEFELVIFMGTWCEDTQRELGGIFKLVDALEIADANITMYALNEDKESEEGYEKPYSILNIPTLIFLKDGQEVNRIVELPVDTLHEDMQKIITGQPYQNAYDF